MSGHLFVVCGDIRNLLCDAWLLPTDVWLSLSACWHHPPRRPDRPDGWSDESVRAIPGARARAGQPRVWWVNEGNVHGRPIDWFVSGAVEFVDRAARSLKGRPPLTDRAKHLLAVPFVGSGAGGGAHKAGDILKRLLPALRDAADEQDVDVVFVARTPWVYSLAQALRRQDETRYIGGELNVVQVGKARSLANEASAGKLVLFIGAGVSAGAGLPAWKGLLDEIAAELGISAEQRSAFQELNVLDWARLLEHRCVGESTFAEKIATRLSKRHYALAHSLLAALPVDELVTTNYDNLLEKACHDADRECAVLPYEPAADGRRWLLKLHGCVSHPNDIVITRDDYLRYADRRSALAGIVQALLVTRHMLFVGFSLDDDNFHRIAHDVRKAIGEQARSKKLGTALKLTREPLKEDLWQKEFRLSGSRV